MSDGAGRVTRTDDERAVIDFRARRPSRLRVNGIASIYERDALHAHANNGVRFSQLERQRLRRMS